MKIAIFSESEANEAAIQILVGAILKRPVNRISGPPILARGFGSILSNLPTVIRHLYYRTEAEGLVVVCDSDDTPVHTADHDTTPAATCRLCLLRAIVAQTLLSLRPINGRQILQVSVGLAVPAIEAWYLCGTAEAVHESSFSRAVQEGKQLYVKRRELKKAAYGMEAPSRATELAISIDACNRLSGQLEALRQNFPIGFGKFYEEIAAWR